MTTLIFIRHGQIGDRQFAHGDELPPGLIPKELQDRWLDQKWLKEYDAAERRSVFRLLHIFSGCNEQEQLSREEKEQLCL
jgi:hypothetical protein